MKKIIITTLILLAYSFPLFANEVANKGLICNTKQKPTFLYYYPYIGFWFGDKKVEYYEYRNFNNEEKFDMYLGEKSSYKVKDFEVEIYMDKDKDGAKFNSFSLFWGVFKLNRTTLELSFNQYFANTTGFNTIKWICSPYKNKPKFLNQLKLVIKETNEKKKKLKQDKLDKRKF